MFEISALQRRGLKTSQLLRAIVDSLEADSNFNNLTSDIISKKLKVSLDQKTINEIMVELCSRIENGEHKFAFGYGFADKINGWCFGITSSGMEPVMNLLFAVEQEENSSEKIAIQINMNHGDVNNEINSD